MSLKAMGNVTVINVNDGQDGQPGQQGIQGVSIVNSVPQYYLSTSSTQLVGGSWAYTPWEVTNGTFLWERLENTLSDGSTVYSDAVYSVTISGVKHDVDSINNSITNKVWQSDITTSINSYDNSTVSNIRDRVTQTETDITGITSRVSDVESDTSDLGTRMTSAETTIQQTSENVLIQATSSATTAAEGGQYLINSLINVAPSGVQIAADKVNIAGAAIFSNYALKSQTVSDVVVEYAKSTSSSSFTPVSGTDGEWSIGMPDWSEGTYIWQRTSKTINGNTTYSYTCVQGAKGQDGTSVSITEIKYATSSTDSQPSDSSFTYDSVPTVAEGSWLWTRTTYSSGTKLYTKSKQGVSGTNGTNGTNGLNVATVYLYQRATSSPSKPSSQLTYTFSTGKLSGILGNWTQEIPSGTNPIWMTIATASASTTTDTIASSEWTTPVEFVKNGTNGTNGTDGTNGLDGYNQATINLYRRAASTPSKPSSAVTYTFSTGALSSIPSGWSKTIPDSDGNPCYVTSVSIASRDATYSIAATSWSSPTKLVEDGEQGDHGLNVATIYLYQRATSSPSKPNSTLTYTFADGTLTGTLGSWEQSVPSGTNPVWMTLATASASTATDTIASSEWVDPVQLVKDGTDGTDGIDGYNQATITLYRRAASAPSKPSSAVTYTFATGELSSTPSGWERTVPTSDGNPCYATSVTAISRDDTYPISSSSWSDVVKLVEDGDSAVVYSITPSVYAITKNEAGTLTPTSVTFSATSKIGSGNASAYSGRFIIAESSNGTSWTNKYTSSSNESSKAYTPSANTIKFIRCSLYLAGGTTTLLDQETVAVVSDGIQGYSVVAYVTRDSFTESQWTTYGTIDHSESWSNTSDIRNGCRVGDLFAVVGTSTDGGKSHTAIYRATNASGNLAGTCIAHTYSDKGDDGDDAYTVILTNESHSFAAGTSAAVEGTAICKVITYKGTGQIKCYVGASSSATSISTGVTGLTCSISNNDSTNVTLTFTATTNLTAKNGTVSIPVVVDGKSFTKLFTFSLSLTGTSVTSVTTTQSDVDDGYSMVTITLSDGSSKQFQVKNGSKGSTGDTAQWFYGTAMSHTSGTATVSVTDAVVGSMYLNTDSSNVYKCTNISGSTMTWTYAGNLITGLIDNIEIGGTNLIIGGSITRGYYINSSGAQASHSKSISSDYIPVNPSTDYTLQYWQPTNSQTGNNRAWSGKFCWYTSSKTYINGYSGVYFGETHVSYTATSPSNAAYVRVSYLFPNGATVTPAGWNPYNKYYKWKLERGNIPSDWSMAPQDVLAVSQPIYRRTSTDAVPTAPSSIVEYATDPTDNSAQWTTMHISRINPDNVSYKYLWTCNQLISVGGQFLGVTEIVADKGTTVIDGDTITTGTINTDRLNVNDIISQGSIIVSGSNISSLTNDAKYGKNHLYGTCSTAAGTQTKVVTCSDFELGDGNEITVTFTNSNTYTNSTSNAHSSVKLNINSKGAKDVWVDGLITNANTTNGAINRLLWGAGATVSFVCKSYNNDYIFEVIGEPRTWYGASTTATGTATKTDTTAATGCVICKGTVVELTMTNANTNASPTLNIRSTGALPIYVGENTTDPRPLVSNGLSWIAGATQQFRFDGVDWDCSLKSASSYTTAINSSGLFIHRDTGVGALSITDPTANGVHISDDIDVIRSGKVVASYGDDIVLGEGSSDEYGSWVIINNRSLYIRNNTGNIESTWLCFEDLRDGSGVHTIQNETVPRQWVNNPSSGKCYLSCSITNIISVKVNNVDQTSNAIKSSSASNVLEFINGISINGNDTIVVTYTTQADAYVFSMGTRYGNYDKGIFSVSIGKNNIASQYSSIAIGSSITSTGLYSFGEGTDTTSSGYASHSEGASTTASGYASHSQNLGTIAAGHSQTAIGKYNKSDTGNYSFIIGNGDDNLSRSNAFTVDWDGNAYCYPKTINLGTYVSTGILTGSGGHLMFSIPLGRTLPSNASISLIEFDVCARCGYNTANSGAGYYIVKDSASGTSTVHVKSNDTSRFYNAGGIAKDLLTSHWTGNSIQGNTNIYISWNTNTTDFFTQNATNRGYLNNQPVTVFLANINITLTYS